MIEAGVSLAVAGITGACVLVSRLHGRIHQLTRFEGHIVRIEGKLDTLKDNIIIRQQ